MINIGLVGCGRVSGKHFKAIERVGKVELFAVCDNNPRALDGIMKFGSIASVYLDYYDLLQDEDVDVISICTPSDLHADMVIEAANAGKHVLCEKPLDNEIYKAAAAIKACEENNVKLSVVTQNRFNPPMIEMKRLLDEGKLGEVLMIAVVCRWYRPQSYYDGTWQGSWKRSGGILLNQAMHHIDALLYFAGDVKEVNARTATLGHEIDFPDSCVASLVFESGALGTFEASTVSYPYNVESSISIIGSKGTMKVGGVALDKTEYMTSSDLKYRIDDYSIYHPRNSETGKEYHADIYGHSHIMQYEDMRDAILEDREPVTSGTAALKAIKLADWMYYPNE